MAGQLVCWKCGASLEDMPKPLARLAECPACNADLYVCRLCEFFDTRVARQCRETVADEVKEKERANFCDYFQPRPDAWQPHDTTDAEKAKSELDALFGSGDGAETGEQGDARKKLDDLFK